MFAQEDALAGAGAHGSQLTTSQHGEGPVPMDSTVAGEAVYWYLDCQALR